MSIRDCTKCGLHKTRTNVVLARGHRNARILFVGEAPGEDEDREGEPFVGRSGQFLRSVVDEVGLTEYGVVYDNVIKCRPKSNKNPDAVQIFACYNHLENTIASVRPEVIVPLGGPALNRILRTPDITQRQGEIYWHMKYNAWVVPQFHPAYILRQMHRREDYVQAFEVIKSVASDPDLAWAPQVMDDELNYTIVESSTELQEIWNTCIKDAQFLTFDTEARMWTPGLIHPFMCDLMGISLCWEPGRALYLPVYNTTLQKPVEWPESTLDLMRHILSSDIPKGAHNSNFDRIILQREMGVDPENVVDDTMVAGHCWMPAMSKGLQAWSSVVGMAGYDWGIDPWTRGKKKKEIDYSQIPHGILGKYACGDADCTFRLAWYLNSVTPERQRGVYYNISLPMVHVVKGMEWRGVRVDKKGAIDLDKRYRRQLEVVQADLDVQAGDLIDPSTFNWNSPAQVKRLLFDPDNLGLPVVKRTKTKQRSFDRKAKKALRGRHPIVDLLAERERLTKALSVFVKPLMGPMLDAKDKVHTIYWVPGTETGRLSSSNINLQQITKPTEAHPIPRIRNLFLAPPGGCLAALDVDRAELATLGMYCQDPDLQRAMAEGVDVHLRMASMVHGVREHAITKPVRDKIKSVTFGLLYGQTPVGLSEELNIPVEEAEELNRLYFDQFPTIRDWMDEELCKARGCGYVENIFGRRRYFLNLHDSNDTRRAAEERKVVNTLTQGTTTDIISLGTIAVDNELRRRRKELMAWLIMTIHDAVIVECLVRRTSKSVGNLLKSCMLGVGKQWELDIHLRGEVKYGRRWGDMDIGTADAEYEEAV